MIEYINITGNSMGECDKCINEGFSYNEDGDYLCEDCLMEYELKRDNEPEQGEK